MLILLILALMTTISLRATTYVYVNSPIADVYLLSPENKEVAILHEKIFTDPYIAQLLRHNNANLNTQALYAEPVIINENNTKWAKISLPEQGGASGFIDANSLITLANKYQPNCVIITPWARVLDEHKKLICFLPMGSKVEATRYVLDTVQVHLLDGRIGYIHQCACQFFNEENENTRERVCYAGKQLVGLPYWWGGKVALNRSISAAKGFDCSGLIYTLYRTVGIPVARNSRAQYNQSIKLSAGAELFVGDCVFFAKPERPQHIVHVLLYCGNDLLLEASPERGLSYITSAEKFGESIQHMYTGNMYNNKVVYFGRLIKKE